MSYLDRKPPEPIDRQVPVRVKTAKGLNVVCVPMVRMPGDYSQRDAAYRLRGKVRRRVPLSSLGEPPPHRGW